MPCNLDGCWPHGFLYIEQRPEVGKEEFDICQLQTASYLAVQRSLIFLG